MYQNINKIYHAAIYVRLSKEDGDISSSAKLESNSISNQKALILDFLKDKKDIEVVSVRVDDGYSGSNFERPAFQAMLEDIRRGVVDCVVVKDLSRFGREYIDSGKYIERLFPALGVRFIAINDNYDSLKGKNQADEIIIPFKNLINDAYCRDISIKIRSNLEIKRKKGECVTPFVAFGYRKTKTDKHKLEIDPSAGGVVQDIFKMKLQGMSQDAIANRLNELGILSPFEYKISSGSRYETGFRQKEQALWSSVTVRRILENEVYIGNLVQGKRTTPNHKVKQTYVKPEDDWIRIEKNHEPLVSDRDFEIVQRLLGMDTRTSPDQKQVYLLSGIAVCADCGAPMTRKISTVAGKKYAYYLCSANKETKRCSSHRIPEKDLEDAVLVMLKQHIQNILHLKRVLEFVGTVPFQEINMKKLQDRLEKKKQETERCKELRMMLYSDMKEGIVSKEDYVELHAAYGKRLRNAEESIRAIQKEMDSELEKADNANTWLDYFVKYQDIEELSRTVVVELIRKIRVYDKKNIEITFDFDDCYQTLPNQLPAMGVDTVIDDDNNLQVKVTRIWGKTRCSMHTGHKAVLNDETEWVRLENHHTAIIDRALFEKANEMHPKKKRSVAESRTNFILERRKKQPALLICANCGHSLLKETEHLLKCSDARTNGDPVCRSLVIRREPLEENILGLVHQYAASMLEKEKKVSSNRQCDYKEINMPIPISKNLGLHTYIKKVKSSEAKI